MNSNIAENPIISGCIDDDIRITGGPTPQEGTVEVCKNRVWGGVCQYRWDSSDANVACSQLGYQPVGNGLYICMHSSSC